jgi:hypothetical protein
VIRPSEPLKVLIACEFSGCVRRQFDKLGHDAWSCDLRRAEDGSNRHIVGDVREVIQWGWDLIIVAHPPCTRLCNSGVRWLSEPPTKLNPAHHTAQECLDYQGWSREERLAFMWRALDEGAALFSDLWNADCPRIAVENPVMHRFAKERIRNYREFSQSVQPWEYGDWETKRTCLWLKGLEPLVPTYRTLDEARRGLGKGPKAKPTDRVHKMAPGADRDKERSRFFDGIAEAMALQWGGVTEHALDLAA